MIRGTTTLFKYKLPYALSEFEWITIKFWQPNNTRLNPITRRLEEDDLSSQTDTNEVAVSLTSAETAEFLDQYKARMQLRALHNTGTVFGSRPQWITVYPMLDDFIQEDELIGGESANGLIILDGNPIAD